MRLVGCLVVSEVPWGEEQAPGLPSLLTGRVGFQPGDLLI